MAKKTKAKKGWKQKKIYKITAPDSFDQQEVGTTMSSNEANLIGRTVEVPLKELTGDRSKQHIKLIFEVDNVVEAKAKTKFKRFYINQQYIRSKMRKGITKVDSAAKLKIENATIWIKIVSATQTKVNSSKATGINKKVLEIINRHRKLKVNDFVQLALFGKLGTEIYHEIKKISPTKRVEVEELRVV